MGFSISGGVRAWRFDDLDPNIVASQIGSKPSKAKSELAVLRRLHTDAAWIDQTIRELSVPSLAILATLVDAGGYEADYQVLEDAARTYNLSASSLSMAVAPLLHKLLVVTTTTGRERQFSLVEPSAALVAARLRDVDIAPLPTNTPFVAAESLDDGRALLAVCGALGHVELKLTQAGLPHRTGIKRMAKSIGLDEELLERLVVLGLELDVLATVDDGVIRPDVRRLRELARGSSSGRPQLLGMFIERLRTSQVPMSLALIERWIATTWRNGIGTPPRAQDLGSVPGLRRGKVGDIHALAPEALDGAAAASITPSFEVFVPPESRAEHLVEIIACAELVRLDRVVVARITKGSIHRAVAAGMSAASMLACLSETSRTPLPQNVAAAITDWASSEVAVTAVGRVVIVPITHEARVVKQLESYGARVIAPGVILVRASTSPRALADELARLGVPIRRFEAAASDDVHDDDSTSKTSRDVREAWSNRLPLPGSGATELQRRFAAYRAGDAEELAKVPAGGHASHPASMRSTLAHAEDNEDDNDDDSDDDGWFISTHAIERIESWEVAHRCKLDDQIATTAGALLDVISTVDQRFLLGAKNPSELFDRVRKVGIYRGGFEALVANHPDVFASVLGSELSTRGGNVESPTRPAPGQAGPGQAGLLQARPRQAPGASSISDADREWHTQDLHARLVAAARTHSTYTLGLQGGRITTVRIRKVIQRGTVTMVLGEDIEDDSAVAVPLHTIARIAEPVLDPLQPEDAGDISATSGMWRPLDGQSAPAGHVPCPCGSGRRYRSCCRVQN